jgi:hypothetical protein
VCLRFQRALGVPFVAQRVHAGIVARRLRAWYGTLASRQRQMAAFTHEGMCLGTRSGDPWIM